MKTCLILGRTAMVLDNVKDQLQVTNVELVGGINMEDVKKAFENHKVDAVIMGAGLDIKDRLAIITYVFEKSKSTTVHMKDWNSGPAGMLPFVNGVLLGLNEMNNG